MIDAVEYIKLPKQQRQDHLDLTQPCLERGGNSTNHRGVLAQYLNTTIPAGRVLLCHACSNAACSNPNHLYWGTDKENVQDAKEAGTWKSMWQRLVDKYGYDEACAMNQRNSIGNKGGAGNKGKPKSEEHRKKISEGVKKQKQMRE